MYDSYLSVPSGFLSDLDRMRGDLDSLFGWGGTSRAIRSTGGSTYPAINVGQSPEAVDVYVFAPGIDASRTEVTLDRGVLTISGERASDLPAEAPKTSVHGRERYAGKFRHSRRTMSIHQVSATYRDGVLRVKSAGARPRPSASRSVISPTPHQTQEISHEHERQQCKPGVHTIPGPAGRRGRGQQRHHAAGDLPGVQKGRPRHQGRWPLSLEGTVVWHGLRRRLPKCLALPPLVHAEQRARQCSDRPS
jgi:HSP20 family protein